MIKVSKMFLPTKKGTATIGGRLNINLVFKL